MTVVPKPEDEPPLFGGVARVVFGASKPAGDPIGGAPPAPAVRLLRAVTFAEARHRGQVRKDQAATPYIAHPISVATILADEGGVDDVDVLVAALLHDTVEDTATTLDDIRRFFGDTVVAIVAEVTDDRSRPKAERKLQQVQHAPTLSSGAKLVKLADKIANLRDLANQPPVDWNDEQKKAYADWADSVVNGLRGANEHLESAFDDARSALSGSH